jgi:apolipoprotein D and lipocalin family protein
VYRLIPLVLLLAACAPAPTRLDGFRTQGPIYSNAVLVLTTLTGTWQQVAAFATKGRPGCRPGGAQIDRSATGLTVNARLCLNGRDTALSGPLAITGPGRLTPAKAASPLNREWWVLWADADLRTLVIGTPDGSFGFILNRGGPLPPDRLTAAREILDWNGYDTRRLALFR